MFSILAQAELLPNSPLKIEMLERAVELADSLGEESIAYQARQELISAAVFGGQPHRAFSHFEWCLAAYDRNPELDEAHLIYWIYKWMIEAAIQYPSVSQERLQSLLNDQERRYCDAGFSLRPNRGLWIRYYLQRGDLERVRELVSEWRRLARDEMSDCPACERDLHVLVLLELGETDKALQRAQPLLLGRLRCEEVPHLTVPRLLIPWVAKGHAQEAARHHEKNWRRIRGKLDFLHVGGYHAAYLAVVGKIEEALSCLEEFLPSAFKATRPQNIFEFCLAAWFVLERLPAGTDQPVRVRLPEQAPISGHVNLADPNDPLRQWLVHQAKSLAQAFDTRNGTDWFSQRLHRQREQWHQLADSLARGQLNAL